MAAPLDKSPLVLSDEFKDILSELEDSREHYFITGRAGTGKSTLLSIFRNTSRKRIAVLAPTGIAALNVRGQTIHSFFGFPPRMIDRADISPRRNRRLYRNVDTIIIDEISMVRADMLDNIDYFLQVQRECPEPFGGVQMIFFGDLFQLPPVLASPFEKQYFRTHYESPFFFSSRVWQREDATFYKIELQKVYRQEERGFIRLLDNIRTGTMDYDDLMDINERHVDVPEDLDYVITLTSINKVANQINQHRINTLVGEERTYGASVVGNFDARLFPVDLHLTIKTGAQIMFVKNDPQRRFVNGSIGKVVDCQHDKITVSAPTPDGDVKIFDVERLEWEVLKYQLDEENASGIKTQVVGSYKQYPIKPAWAITIHKSQGKTFDQVIIDMGSGAFAAGQTYVALSRCRTFHGIYLRKALTPRDIMVDPVVVEFYDNYR
jgi:ATP-dependent exoDNAse (exonuclease V) alpha subunit